MTELMEQKPQVQQNAGDQSPQVHHKGYWARNRIPLTVVAIALAAMVIVALIPRHKVEPPREEVPPVPVKVLLIQPRSNIADTFDLPGLIEPINIVKVAAEVSGRIEAYGPRSQASTSQASDIARHRKDGLDEGDHIAAGQEILHLNIELIKAELDQAKEQQEFNERDLQRIEELHAKNVATKLELDQARTKTNVGRALLNLFQFKYDRATIKSPVSGTIDRLPAEIGEYVTPGTIVAQIVDVSKVKVACDVPERDVRFLKVGQQHDVMIDSPLGGTEIVKGTISYISQVGDSMTRTSRVEIAIDNADGKFRSQQVVRVRFTRQMLNNVVMIPLMAVIPLEEDRDVYHPESGLTNKQTTPVKVVYVEVDGKAQQKKIEIGFLKGTAVGVAGGLQTGDKVIVDGNRQISPGQAVQVTDTYTATTSPASPASPSAEQQNAAPANGGEQK